MPDSAGQYNEDILAENEYRLTSGTQIDKKQVSPRVAWGFFFDKCMLYGLGFGGAYGAAMGLIFFIVGAIFGAVGGGILGLFLGLIEGFFLPLLAALLVRKNVAMPVIARSLQCAAPIIMMAVGAWPAGIFGHTSEIYFSAINPLIVKSVYFLAVLGSWHAAYFATKAFMEEYDFEDQV